MYGDDRKRFCGDCKLNVYNLSGMSREEAEALIMNAEGRLCVRFYKRRDGSVITGDCPVGWARVKQRAGCSRQPRLNADGVVQRRVHRLAVLKGEINNNYG